MERSHPKDISTSATPSLWTSEAPGKAYPRLDQSLTTQVLVIGGGITGLSCAYELTEAGYEVVLVEKDRLSSKATGNTTGKLTLQHNQYGELLNNKQEKAARDLLASQEAALRRFREITATLSIQCGQTETSAVYYGRTSAELEKIEQEAAAYDRLGIPYDRLKIAFEPGEGLAVPGQIAFNPALYVQALADHLASRGVLIFEHSQVEHDLEEVPEGLRVKVRGGYTVTAKYIIVASGYPAIDDGAHYAFRLVPSRSLALAYPVEAIEQAMYISESAPLHSVRYHESDRKYLIVVGGSHRVAFESDVASLGQELKDFAASAFGVAAPSHQWSAQDYLTADRLPYIGRLTNQKKHQNVFVATGFRKWGLGFGIWTGQYLTALIRGTQEEIESFRPSRDLLTKTALDQAADKASMLVHALTDRQRPLKLEDIGNNQGGIVKHAGKKRGVFKDEAGVPTFISLACTHMGCSLHWNNLDQSFDCPCHGSRFTKEGFLIEGPADRDLTILEEELTDE